MGAAHKVDSYGRIPCRNKRDSRGGKGMMMAELDEDDERAIKSTYTFGVIHK